MWNLISCQLRACSISNQVALSCPKQTAADRRNLIGLKLLFLSTYCSNIHPGSKRYICCSNTNLPIIWCKRHCTTSRWYCCGRWNIE